MNSRCLYCDKRLSLFHGKKKPFCSDVHEDLYLERQAVSGLDRLRDDSADVGPVRPVKPTLPPSPKPPEQFAYPELEPGFFDEDPEPSHPTAPRIPPPADYLISSANAVLPAAPFRDPAQAAFVIVPWTRPTPLEGFYAWLTPAPAQTAPLAIELEKTEPPPPPLVTSMERLPMPLFALANLHLGVDASKIAAMPGAPQASSLPRLETEPLDVKPESEPPAMATTPAPVQTAAVRLPDPDAPRTFRDCTLDVAVPRLIYPPPHRAPKFDAEARPTEAPAVIVSRQVLEVEPLPQPQPLRLRTLLDLRGSVFRTAALRLTPAPLATLSWNAAPPETALWPLAAVRRRPAPVLPKLMSVPPAHEQYYDYQPT